MMLDLLLILDVLVTFILICYAIAEIKEPRASRLMFVAIIGVVIGYVLLYIGVTNRTGR
jgi:L-cystine uptake protein TcyP (sodium:dicarboxylate symporter family)